MHIIWMTRIMVLQFEMGWKGLQFRLGKILLGWRHWGNVYVRLCLQSTNRKWVVTRKVGAVVQVVVLLLLVLFNRNVLYDIYRVLDILNINFVCSYCYDCVNIMVMSNIVCTKLQCIKLSFNFLGNIYGKQFLTILKSCPSFSLSLCSHHPHGKRCLLTPESHMC